MKRGAWLVVAGVLLAGCSSQASGGTASSGGGEAAPSASPSGVGADHVEVSPTDAATGVRLDASVTVSSAKGLQSVKVTDSRGGALAGDLSGSSWHSTSHLAPSETYTVQAQTERGTSTSTFTTLTPPSTAALSVDPLGGEVVGVGMPIILQFSKPVKDEKAVEGVLHVYSSTPVQGAWHWYSSKEVHFRPTQYWAKGQRVRVVADVAGVEISPGVWGAKDRDVTFSVGDSHVTQVDGGTHQAVVYVNGAAVRTMPASLGRPGDLSMEGAHNVLYKAPQVVMDSSTVGVPVNSPDGYRETVYWDVAITGTGEFVHAAPWSVGAQGRRNVSHGCVNVSPQNAQWFYGLSQRGDIVNVTNTGRGPDLSSAGNDWSVPWDQWVKGSAGGEVTTRVL